MNKKLKKIIATVSAVAMCTVSMTVMTSGALYIYNTMDITPDTISFTADSLKYGIWQEMNDYFNNENWKFFISEDGKRDVFLRDGNISLWEFNGYLMKNEEDVIDFEQYLTDNNIEYEQSNMPFYEDSEWLRGTLIKIVRGNFVNDEEYEAFYTDNEYFQLIQKIKEDTGLVQGLLLPTIDTTIEVTDVENVLPEPTLTGDANEDGEVKLSDAVLIMQALSNPDEYQLTPQGIANADMDGDGITPMDALRIQEIALGK